MTNPSQTPEAIHPIAPLAAFLSYLIPGLGQVYQGRFGKGVLFFACIYILFFYGNALASGSVTLDGHGGERITYRVSGAVYLPDVYVPKPGELVQPPPIDGVPQPPVRSPFALNRLGTNLYNRLQFVGQFWVGVAAWPALYQYAAYGNDQVTPDPRLGFYMREPSETAINAVQTTGSKSMDLGWVFTVIAGVLNIMVIYDAFAGPAVPRALLLPVKKSEPAATETPAEEKQPEVVAPLPTTEVDPSQVREA